LGSSFDRCDTDGVPTDIYFAAEDVRVSVHEDPNQVAEAFTSADGFPFRLTSQGRRDEVYINPATVAFWRGSDSSREPAPPEESRQTEPEPPQESRRTEPAAVTDIWGNPLGRKRRR
jgi:hypothetical protein